MSLSTDYIATFQVECGFRELYHTTFQTQYCLSSVCYNKEGQETPSLRCNICHMSMHELRENQIARSHPSPVSSNEDGDSPQLHDCQESSLNTKNLKRAISGYEKVIAIDTIELRRMQTTILQLRAQIKVLEAQVCQGFRINQERESAIQRLRTECQGLKSDKRLLMVLLGDCD